MIFYYVYVLRSDNNSFYVGYTENLKSRFEQHRKGQVESTKDRRSLIIVYSEESLDKSYAIHREKYLKTTWTGGLLRTSSNRI